MLYVCHGSPLFSIKTTPLCPRTYGDPGITINCSLITVGRLTGTDADAYYHKLFTKTTNTRSLFMINTKK